MTTPGVPSKGAFADSLFHNEPAGALSDGHIFMVAPEIRGDQQDPSIGYWHCDIAQQDQLAWSDKVYELFGFDVGSPVDREQAVARYTDSSKATLEKVRSYALSRRLGFLLDAEIRYDGKRSRWIRVLAVPIVKRGRVVAVHRLKRAL